MKKVFLALTIFALALMPMSTMAATIGDGESFTTTASKTIGSVLLSAEVTFSIVSGDLNIVLKNTTADTSAIAANILHAVFWTSSDVLPTAGATAKISSGSFADIFTTALSPDYPALTNVGGEFAYASGILAGVAPQNANQGISSAGYGIFGDGNLNGSNLTDTVAVGGIDFGIVGPSYVFGSGNNPQDAAALIQNSVTFVFDTAYTGTSKYTFSDVNFQYGTGLNDPNIAPIPGSLLLLGSGVLGLIGLRRKLS
jgi:hypothetical protein